MAEWVLTATTIYCDAIDDDVTIIIKGDDTLQCTGHMKYSKPTRETSKSMKIKSKHLGRQLRCEGLDCHRVAQYREKLRIESAGAQENTGHE